jgi:hypothetical protein
MTVEPEVPAESAEPLALIESAILETQRGILPVTELFRAFMDTEIILPSAAPAESLQTIEPLLWQRDGANLVGVFTHSQRALLFADMTPHAALMTGRKALSFINPSAGLLVNPGSQHFSFVITPVAAASMRKEFGV